VVQSEAINGRRSGPAERREPGAPLPFPSGVTRWAAVHAKPRAEKVVAEWLAARGVRVFLPLARKRRRYGARVRDSWIPLFPGYLFYDFPAIDRLRVFDSRRVARVLVPDDEPQLRRDLESLAAVLATNPDLRPAALDVPGTQVEVVDGPFQGATGELVRHGGMTRLVLRIHFLGFGAEMEVDESWVRPLPAAGGEAAGREGPEGGRTP
jgi:transcription antitermination factor NusG